MRRSSRFLPVVGTIAFLLIVLSGCDTGSEVRPSFADGDSAESDTDSRPEEETDADPTETDFTAVDGDDSESESEADRESDDDEADSEASIGQLSLPDELDFGIVDLGSMVYKTLYLRNSGQGPLAINAISLEIPSGTGFLPSEPGTSFFTLAAGATRGIRLQFSRTDVGTAQNTLLISSSAADAETLVSRVRLYALWPYAPSPAELTPTELPFKDVEIGQAPCLEVQLKNGGSGEFSRLHVGAAALSTQAEPAFVLAPEATTRDRWLKGGGQVNIPVCFSPFFAKSYSATLTIQTSAGALTVPLSGTGIIPRFYIHPLHTGTFHFGSIQIGDTSARTLLLENTGSVPIRISSIGLRSNEVMTLDAQALEAAGNVLNPGARLQLGLSFSPAARLIYNTTLTILSDCRGAESLFITVRGSGVQSPLVFEPASYAFDPTPIGAEQHTVVVLRNRGADALLIASASFDFLSSDFDFGADPFTFVATTIAAGASLEVPLRFKPGSEGPLAGSLSISASFGTGSELTLPLSGSGLAASPPARPRPN